MTDAAPGARPKAEVNRRLAAQQVVLKKARPRILSELFLYTVTTRDYMIVRESIPAPHSPRAGTRKSFRELNMRCPVSIWTASEA